MILEVNKECFSDCATDFSTNKLSPQEIGCMKNCVSRAMTQQKQIPVIIQSIDSKYGDRF
jgi:hypothetical protein